jgi:hypothetical protein
VEVDPDVRVKTDPKLFRDNYHVIELTEDAYVFMLFLAIKADIYKKRKKID